MIGANNRVNSTRNNGGLIIATVIGRAGYASVIAFGWQSSPSLHLSKYASSRCTG